MAIWKIIPDPDLYDCLYLVDASTQYIEVFDSGIFASGKRIGSSWIPIDVYIEPGEKPGEFPSLPGGIPLVFSERALRALEPLISTSIEALSLGCEAAKLYAINILDIVDCLDYSRAHLTRFSDSGKIMRIEKFAFYDECVKGHHIFKIPELKVPIFVSDAFKRTVDNHHLEGLIFIQVA